MPLTGKTETRLQQLGRGGLAALAGLMLLTGCASTEQKQAPRLTGNLMVDGPLSIEQGPPRDKVLWEYRTAAGAMRQGKFDLAKQYLDDALLSLGGAVGKDKNAKQARGYFHAEAKKTFIGEPYERSMAYIYRGILYWMDGEPDNARACFRSAELADSDSESHQYAGDWVLPDYLDGFASAKLGGDGSDAFKRAEAASRNVKLPPYNPKANVLFFIEFGPGPVKYASGEYSEQLRFHYSPSPVLAATVKVDSFTFPVAPTDDVAFQATTRGGRVMDHILGNKAVFKSATDVAGNVGIIGGAATLLAGGGHNSTVNQVGVGLLAAGILSKVVSAATTPEADTRAWDNLPRYLSFASLPLTPGTHTVTVEFQDAGGRVLPSFTKTLTVQVPADGKDKVIFISDQSITPQNI